MQVSRVWEPRYYTNMRTKKSISHASRSLIAGEKSYSQIEKKALPIIFAMKTFINLYIVDNPYYRHHRPLLSMWIKKGVPTHTANKLGHWETILFNYNYKTEFLPSKKKIESRGLTIQTNTKILRIT